MPTWPQSSEQIINKVRFPRVLLGILVGASLSIAGAGLSRCAAQSACGSLCTRCILRSFCRSCIFIYFGLQLRLVRAMVDSYCGLRDGTFFLIPGS